MIEHRIISFDEHGVTFQSPGELHDFYDDKQEFATLYKAFEDIGTIAQRGIKDGGPGYKKALQKIMVICRGIE